MKKMFLLMIALVVLAGPTFLGAYDLTAHYRKVLPEAIYAAATGGGTWTTEVQITNAVNVSTTVNVYFYYGGGNSRGPFELTTLAAYNTYRTTNILNAIDILDTGTFDYYGRVGAIWFFTGATAQRIHVTSKTMHSGGYGKSLPALYPDIGTTAAVSRWFIIPLMYNGSVNRSTTGFFNTNQTTSMNVTFYLISPSWSVYGSFTKTFVGYDFQAFNPFIQAGIDADVYTNAWLYVFPLSGPDYATERGLACFGSIVNNTTNDPTAVLAYPFELANTAAATEAASLSPDPNK
jgi:hypothetical protein